jgi:predicted ribosomally synthesized peptide with SipW-like signal peptide
MKRILLSLVVIAAVGSLAVGATISQFSDTETASDNTFSAGTLDLKTNNLDGVTNAYTLANMTPGAWENAGQVILKNAGSIKGHAWYEITNVRNYENTCIEPEVGDVTCGTGADQGELGGLAKASLQANKDTAPTNYTRYPVSAIAINSAAGVHYDIKDLDPNETLPLVVYGVWTNDGAADNLAQSDSVMFDIVFHLDQILP